MLSIVDALPRDQFTDEGLCPLLTRVLSPQLLHAAGARATRPRSRRRKLPVERLLLLVIAMNLYSDDALAVVAEQLWLGLGWMLGTGGGPPSKSAITQGRHRLGVAAVRALFRAQCRPLASPTTVGAFQHGLRVVAIDSTFEDVPDTPANERVFGRRRNQHGSAAFPQVMGTYLIECGTHAFLDAVFDSCLGDPHAAGRRLLRSVDPSMLLLWDCGFHSLTLLRTCLERRLSFLGRLGAQVQYPVWRRLPDGSYLAHVAGLPPGSAPDPIAPHLIRVVHYTITDPTRPGYQEQHRLVTSLLDHQQWSARELILLYHERWEFELALDEIDTHLRPPRRPLRSQTLRGVIQELYGVLLAHWVLSSIMVEAADQAGMDPDRVSFVRTRALVLAVLPLFPFLPDELRSAVWEGLLAALAARPLPSREDRTNPRVVKRQRTKFRSKPRGLRCPPPHTTPFHQAVAVLPPAPQDHSWLI
jgi:hypothetical protein